MRYQRKMFDGNKPIKIDNTPYTYAFTIKVVDIECTGIRGCRGYTPHEIKQLPLTGRIMGECQKCHNCRVFSQKQVEVLELE